MHYRSVLGYIAIPCAALLGCSGESSTSLPAIGGFQSVGGNTSADSALPSGGTASVGGANNTSAAAATGGEVAMGGAQSTGETSATGGAQSATGGSATSGGMPSSGGAKATGGEVSTGGTPSAGGNGVTTPGCGQANTPSPCSKSGTTCSLDVNSKARSYYVQLPSSYSSSKPYPVVFQFHPMGGTAEQALTMYRISSGMPDAIYVTPQGLTASGNTGWANTGGEDIAFTKAMLADVQSKYCVDNARIFSTGFSYGGMMSFAIGCEMGDVFRAIAPMSGALYSDFNCKGTGHAVAMWGSHGLSDDVVPIADGRSARDKILQENHCGAQTVPIDPSPCVSYQGCDSGYPVTWCEWDGKHGIPSFGSSAIAAFFKQF